MKYNKFIIKNYRAIEGPLEIDIKKNKLVPLIGANESGKTTILQAIYAFDYANDKEYEGRHLKELRNFYNPGSNINATIDAEISIRKTDFLNYISDEALRNKYSELPNFSEIVISRNLETKDYKVSVIDNEEDGKIIGKEIVSRLPYIIYNDDFIERPKNEIEIPENPNELYGWLGIYERAFNKNGYSIFDTIKEPEENIKLGILSDVESEINKTLIKEWGRISLDDSDCLSIKLQIENNNILKVQIVEKKGEKDRFFKIEDRSKGFLWFFNFVMKIKYNPKATGSNNDIIYLLDEPGSYLHSVAQEKLCHMIKNISNKDGKVIYCTHTHHLLDPKYIPTKYIYIVQKDKNTKIIDLSKITSVKTDVKKMSELQPVYEALGVSDWDFFNQKQKIIMVEGIHDKYALEIFLGNKLDEYIIMPCVNAESIYNNISRMIAYNKKYIALWDNDEEGNDYYKKALKAFGKLEANRLMVLPNINKRRKVRMEEMFEKSDLSNIAIYLEMPENSSYSNIMTSLICSDDETIEQCRNMISKKSKDNFDELYNMIISIYEPEKSKKKLQYVYN
ncbi:MAG: AAA family ATPase [Bacilli bacterium]|nr:AAA family ATPase [Bacilli bacterium]